MFLDDGDVKNAPVYNRRSVKFLVCNKPLSVKTGPGGEELAFEYKAYGISTLHERERFLKFVFDVYDRLCSETSDNFCYLRIRAQNCVAR
jgi:hypothetical protein